MDIDIVPKNIEYRIEFKKYNIDHHSVAQVKNLSQKWKNILKKNVTMAKWISTSLGFT